MSDTNQNIEKTAEQGGQVDVNVSGDNLPTILNDILQEIDKLAWRIQIGNNDPKLSELRTKDLPAIKQKIDKVFSS